MILYEETLEDIKDFENFKNKLSDSLKSLYDDIDFFNNTKIPTKWEDRNIEKYLNPLLFSFVLFTTTDKYGFDEFSIAILHFGNFVSIVTSNLIIYYTII